MFEVDDAVLGVDEGAPEVVEEGLSEDVVEDARVLEVVLLMEVTPKPIVVTIVPTLAVITWSGSLQLHPP